MKKPDNRNPHPTKKGPGRKHGQGQPHGSAPKQAGRKDKNSGRRIGR